MKVRSMLFISLFTLMLPVLHTSHLEAMGWGKMDELIILEETSWNGAYIDLDKLSLVASIPNYDGGTLTNGNVSLWGKIGDDIGYVITTSYNPNFTPPKNLKGFIKLIQDANPKYIVTAIESKGLGAKYGVDMVPNDSENQTFWRYLSTNNRLIKMGTNDTNESRRLYFFESVFIQ